MMKNLQEEAILGNNPFINALEECAPTELICWECGCEITDEEHIESVGIMSQYPMCSEHL